LNGAEFVLGAKELDFTARANQPGRLYVGACVDAQRAEEPFDWSRVDPSRERVYCSIGSHGGYWNQSNRLRLVQAAVQAFKNRPQYQLLLQLTGQNDENLLGILPENILVAPWFPQLEALSRSALMITHGGFGGVREALFYGVPMILFPCGVDQPGNAARVVQLGAGVMGDIQSVTPTRLGALLDQVMGDPAYRAAAQHVQSVLRANNDCTSALSYLEPFLSGR
jgi:MGT family glycosyltransferase